MKSRSKKKSNGNSHAHTNVNSYHFHGAIALCACRNISFVLSASLTTENIMLHLKLLQRHPLDSCRVCVRAMHCIDILLRSAIFKGFINIE